MYFAGYLGKELQINGCRGVVPRDLALGVLEPQVDGVQGAVRVDGQVEVDLQVEFFRTLDLVPACIIALGFPDFFEQTPCRDRDLAAAFDRESDLGIEGMIALEKEERQVVRTDLLAIVLFWSGVAPILGTTMTKRSEQTQDEPPEKSSPPHDPTLPVSLDLSPPIDVAQDPDTLEIICSWLQATRRTFLLQHIFYSLKRRSQIHATVVHCDHEGDPR